VAKAPLTGARTGARALRKRGQQKKKRAAGQGRTVTTTTITTTRPEAGAWAHGTEGHGGLVGSSGVLADDGLARLVGPVHRDAARLAEWTGDPARYADPRQIHRAGDAAVAALCQHLATMDQFVYPEVLRVVPHAAVQVARLRAVGREMMSTMRGIEQQAQGDVHEPGTAAAELRRDLAAAICDHGRVEEDMLREYDEAVSPEEREDLAADYERMLPHAPSRPHPYISRFGPMAGPVGWRLMGRFDDMLNAMDAREVAGAPVRAPREVGLWGTWLLGRPPQAPSSGTAGRTAVTRTTTTTTREPSERD
jgi:hypothetical protein